MTGMTDFCRCRKVTKERWSLCQPSLINAQAYWNLIINNLLKYKHFRICSAILRRSKKVVFGAQGFYRGEYYCQNVDVNSHIHDSLCESNVDKVAYVTEDCGFYHGFEIND